MINRLFLIQCALFLLFLLSCSTYSNQSIAAPTPTKEDQLTITRLDPTGVPTMIELVSIMPELDAECMKLQLLGFDYDAFLEKKVPEKLENFPNGSAFECFSGETFAILTLLKLEKEAGKLSDRSAYCVTETMKGFNFSRNDGQNDFQSTIAFDTAISLLLCISETESERIALNSIFEEDTSRPGDATMNDLRCLLENSDLQSLKNQSSEPNSEYTFKAEHLKVLADCTKVR